MKQKQELPFDFQSFQANSLINELLVEMVLEFAARAREQADVESGQSVSVEHLEKVLPQAMLDFN